MAANIPEGLTRQDNEKKHISGVIKDFNEPAKKLAEIYNSVEFQKKAEAAFEKKWQKRLLEQQARNEENLKNMAGMGYSAAEIEKKRAAYEERARKEQLKEREGLTKSLKETAGGIGKLKQGLDKSLKSYKDFQEHVKFEIKSLKDAGATDKEIAAYMKQNKDFYDANTKKMISARDKFKSELSDLANNENVGARDWFLLQKQLRMLEKSYDLQELTSNKQSRIFDQMNEDLARLRQSDDEKTRKERRAASGKFKDTLLTTMLGPLRLITDPLLKAVNSNRDTFATFQSVTEKSHARYEIYEKARTDSNKAAEEERKEGRLKALAAGADASAFEKPSAARAGMNALAQSFTPKALFAGLKTAAGFGELSQKEYFDAENRRDARGALLNKIRGAPKELARGLFGPRKSKNEGGLVMEKTPPDENALLKKGAVGAGFVFLARRLARGAGEAKPQSGRQGGVTDFFKKNGIGLLKFAAPIAAMAAGGAMLAAGVKMQKRDTEDARGYFESGQRARGVETMLLGDRARITEENADRELGRTAGKTGLLTGGAGLLAAGGVGTAAMIGTAASAGGVAAAGGLGALGSAGLAAMGAVLPPVLIGAAVVTAGTVIAKGTQAAFELGWDQNQAAIQKELAAAMLSEDSSTMEKVKAGAQSVWKGFTGGLAGGIRRAGEVLEHEMEGAASPGGKVLAAGKAARGFMRGVTDTAMEGQRGRKTAVWEAAALRGMEGMSDEDAGNLARSESYREALSGGAGHDGALRAAYLERERALAVARGDLREDGSAVQEGNWLSGMLAGGAAGGVAGAAIGALAGARFGKYLGHGDTGLAYKTKQSDEEYRQTFEYSKKKTDLMAQGMSAEEADLAAIEEQNKMYEQAMVLRLKRSKDYREEFDKQLREGKTIKEAEEAALRKARADHRNSMTTGGLIRDRFSAIGETLSGFAESIGGFAKSIRDAISDWFGGMVAQIREWRPLDILSSRGSRGGGGGHYDDSVEDGIVTKEGKVIKLSPDDNVYATKNEPRVIRDREAQMAMPSVPRERAEFTDAGIINAIQVLTEVLRGKNMQVNVAQPAQSVNFDQFRAAGSFV